MQIIHLKTTHLENPLGYKLEHLFFSWEVKDTEAITDAWTQVQIAVDPLFENIVFDSGRMENLGVPYYQAPFEPEAATRYYWKVELETSLQERAVSEAAWFETAPENSSWSAGWIAAGQEGEAMPLLWKDFSTKGDVKRARLYCCGLGLYEAYLDGKKLGDEYLLPGYHSYDLMLEYQTFDVTEVLAKGNHKLSFLLGEGWYKGRFVFEGGYENLYGDQKLLTAQLMIWYEDGSSEVFCSDETWRAEESAILSNNIYDGEVVDRNRPRRSLTVKVVEGPTERLVPRMNTPLKKVEEFSVKEVLHTPNGNTILDFGETITGWAEVFGEGELSFNLQYGEWMENGEIYRENLRTAKAEFTFAGKAESEWLRPHFTYYGFRYVKISGNGGIFAEETKVFKKKIKAYRLMSDIERTGEVITSNELVNKLFDNTFRSQKCNFIDIPLDCPQRDERMGWTGDIALFSRTAAFHMYVPAFLNHYMVNLMLEQGKLGGAVPFFVPKPKPVPHEGINPFLVTAGACTWGDAATIVPWELYCRYKDVKMLKEHYPAMKGWVSYIDSRVRENEKPFLWQNDRQLGDWLALDNGNIHNPIGSTDMGLIATSYYFYSTQLCARAAEVLEEKSDLEKYRKQAAVIKAAFQAEYLEENGEIRGNRTQTAYALVLYMGLYDEKKKQILVAGLRHAIEEYGGHLSTGFVGTGLLLQALSENGLEKEAYALLLQEDYPGWLREVKLGATTIWERWNSVNDDGTVSDLGMNSLNHYTYGCVAGWMYEYMCGFRTDSRGDLFISPLPDRRFQKVEGRCRTVTGEYVCGWEYSDNGKLQVTLTIPFQAKVLVKLPWGGEQMLEAGTYTFNE